MANESTLPIADPPDCVASQQPSGAAGSAAARQPDDWLRSQLAWFARPRHLLPFLVSKGTPLVAVLFLGLHGGDVLLLYLAEGMLACLAFACIWPRGADATDSENGPTPGALLFLLACLGAVVGIVVHAEYDYEWAVAAQRLAVPAGIVAASTVFTTLSLAFPRAGRGKRIERGFGVVGRMTVTLFLLLILAPFAVGLHPIGTVVMLIMIDAGLTVLTARPPEA